MDQMVMVFLVAFLLFLIPSGEVAGAFLNNIPMLSPLAILTTGFGDPSGEYWLGNDIIHLLTSSQDYSLEVQLRDAQGNEGHSNYDYFYICAEEKNYSLHFRGFSGSAGRTSSLTPSGTPFSTKDRDNDNCSCKCAQMASGGWWFDACGPSNLNGIYYGSGSNVVRYNGIKWYYWKGPSMMATMTAMMVRPMDFLRAL